MKRDFGIKESFSFNKKKSMRSRLLSSGALLVGILLVVSSIGLSVTIRQKPPSGSTVGYDDFQTVIGCSNGNVYTATASNLQTAVWSLNDTDGGEIELPVGDFYINDYLELKSNISIIGSGYGTRIIMNTDFGGTEGIFHNISGCENIIIKDLYLYGNDSSHSTNIKGIYLNNCSNFLIDNIYVSDTGADGIQIRNSDNGTITNIRANNTGNHAVFVGYTSEYITISDVISHNSKTEIVCIEWTDGAETTENYNKYISVTNCVGDKSENNGYYVQHAKHITMSNLITSNSVNNGFFIRDSYDVTINNLVIDGTTSESNPREGFKIYSNTKDITVTGLHISNTTRGAGGEGIELYECANVKITNFNVYETETNVINNAYDITLQNGQIYNIIGTYMLQLTGSSLNGTHHYKNINFKNDTQPQIVFGIANCANDAVIYIQDNDFDCNPSITPAIRYYNDADEKAILIIRDNINYKHNSLYPFYEQNTAPSVNDNCTAYWYDTDDDYMYQVVNTYGTVYYVNMTTTI